MGNTIKTEKQIFAKKFKNHAKNLPFFDSLANFSPNFSNIDCHQ